MRFAGHDHAETGVSYLADLAVARLAALPPPTGASVRAAQPVTGTEIHYALMAASIPGKVFAELLGQQIRAGAVLPPRP